MPKCCLDVGRRTGLASHNEIKADLEGAAKETEPGENATVQHRSEGYVKLSRELAMTFVSTTERDRLNDVISAIGSAPRMSVNFSSACQSQMNTDSLCDRSFHPLQVQTTPIYVFILAIPSYMTSCNYSNKYSNPGESCRKMITKHSSVLRRLASPKF